jgi:uncharacterized protein
MYMNADLCLKVKSWLKNNLHYKQKNHVLCKKISVNMLITFKISNFLSFNQTAEFLMQAGVAQKFKDHLIKGSGRHDIDILKAAVLYGANASGKSNFVKAIEFAQNLILNGFESVITENKYFRLEYANQDKPTQFEFEFKQNGKMYAYGVILSLKERKIQEEWLFELLKTTDKPVFERKVLPNGKSQIELNVDLGTAGLARFEVYKQDIKATQLFLSEINDKNIDEIPNIKSFKDAFEWFKDALIILYPNSKITNLPFRATKPSNKEIFCELLSIFKTGIEDVKAIEVEVKNEALQEKILTMINEKKTTSVNFRQNGKAYTFTKNVDGIVKSVKLNTLRPVYNDTSTANGTFASFELEEESDGTQRIMDFIPVLLGLINHSRTCIIDEIDRSLHPEVTQNILEFFFNYSQGIESQLIVTTHESNLLNLNLLRRDEIWFVEKNNKGASTMYSLEQFKPRHDKEVRKAYLQGRFGAIPFMANVKNLGWNRQISKT